MYLTHIQVAMSEVIFFYSVEHFLYFGKIFKKMLKMGKHHLFSLSYVSLLKGKIPK